MLVVELVYLKRESEKMHRTYNCKKSATIAHKLRDIQSALISRNLRHKAKHYIKLQFNVSDNEIAH